LNTLKKYGLHVLSNSVEIVLSFFLLTILFYYNIISDKIFPFVKLVVVLITFLVHSFLLSRRLEQKGFIIGLFYALIYILIFTVSSVIFYKFQGKIFLYFFLLIIISILGSLFGIQKRSSLQDNEKIK